MCICTAVISNCTAIHNKLPILIYGYAAANGNPHARRGISHDCAVIHCKLSVLKHTYTAAVSN